MTGGAQMAGAAGTAASGNLWSGALFATVAVVIGFVPAALTLSLRRDAADAIGLSALRAPAWLFIAAWLVIYPCIGIAAWRVTLSGSAGQVERSVALAVLAAGFLQTTSFWLTDSLRSTAVMDATGVVLAVTAAFVLYQVDRSAAWWLVPWVAWMPITLAIKLHALHTPRPEAKTGAYR